MTRAMRHKIEHVRPGRQSGSGRVRSICIFYLNFFIKKATCICHLKSYLSFITYIINEIS